MLTVTVTALTAGLFPLSTGNNSFNLIWENKPKAQTNTQNNIKMCFKGTKTEEKKPYKEWIKLSLSAPHAIQNTWTLHSCPQVTWDWKKKQQLKIFRFEINLDELGNFTLLWV